MPNLSQMKRQRMIEFLNKIKQQHISDDETLIALGEIENELNTKKYGLVWEEHAEKVDMQMQQNIPVFSEIEENEISTAINMPYNFLLEGDNLQSLYLLEKTHKGMIDLIYIDPPYNTGNKDFIYDDNYVAIEDSYRHSKWLSFMSKRLEIAKKLLSEEGAIFIQISDIELSNLKLLCDAIFDENNFLNIISVNMKNIAGASGGGEDKKFKKNCEYILIYAKNYSILPLFNGSYVYTEIADLIQQYLDEGKSWKYTTVLLDSGTKKYVGSTVDGDGNEIKVYARDNVKTMSINQVAKADGISLKEAYSKYGLQIFRTTNAQTSIRTRVIDYKKEMNIDSDIISIEYIPKTGKNKGQVYEQYYKNDICNLFVWLKDTAEIIDGCLYKKDLQGTYWDMNGAMKNLTKEGNVKFSNGKKPLDLMKQIINVYPKNDITVLDYFAGSGTTGHAVIECNKADNGTRNFILCTNNENNICSDTTLVRLQNVIKGYTTDKGKVFEPNLANLKHFKTDFVSRDDEYLADTLLEHIKEMIELEHSVKVDGRKYLIIMNDDEADNLEKAFDEYSELKAIYVSKNVLFTSKQAELFNSKEVYIIPDNYFSFELKEVGESW